MLYQADTAVDDVSIVIYYLSLYQICLLPKLRCLRRLRVSCAVRRHSLGIRLMAASLQLQQACVCSQWANQHFATFASL